MSTILVIGHQNPDNDSIASAVGYAYLKNIIDPYNEYIPARLGPMPKETQAIFEEYGVPVPIAIPHVHKRVGDAMTPNPISIGADMTMLQAGRTFRERGVRALVVIDEAGKYKGLITSRKLAELYVAETEPNGFTDAPVRVGDLVKTCEGRLACGDPNKLLNGKLLIAASEPTTAQAAVSPGDTVILGDRKRTQPLMIEAGAACLLLTCSAQPTDSLIELAGKYDVAIVCTDFDTFTAARFARLSQTVDSYLECDAETYYAEDLLSEATADILASPHRESVVLDDQGYAIGIVTRSDLARSSKRKVILVDHNEISQSAPGIEDAQVVEIVDHHRVGDIQTSSPILFLNFPWGSTSTIVARQFRVNMVDCPREIAAVLLSGIMTDTVMLKSPTTDEEDERQAGHLADKLCVDPVEFGLEVFRSRGRDLDADVDDIISQDSKEYRIGDNLVIVAQHETADLNALLSRTDEIMDAMEEKVRAREWDTLLLMVTDVTSEGSQFLCAGKKRIVEKAFDIKLEHGGVWMPGILSRKKQVVGPLIEHGAS